MTVRRALLAVLAAIWAVTAAAPADAAPAGRSYAGLEVTLTSGAPGTRSLVTGICGQGRLVRSSDAIDLKAVAPSVDDDDVDVDTDESERSGHERYSAVLPRAPDTAADTVEAPLPSHVSSLLLSASVACPQGRAPPALLS